ncbi:MAG: hypothetical protein SA339_11270 [Methanomassiliicoccus sp.]|nr:hypothetical protein [Methanomassiliicoccus sp.]
MEYLVLMKLRDDGVGETEKENKEIVESKIIPSIKMLIDMEGDGMLSGGFFGGQRSAAFIMSVEDEETLDDTIATLPFADIFDVEMVQLEPLKEALERDVKLLKPAPARSKQAGNTSKSRSKRSK